METDACMADVNSKSVHREADTLHKANRFSPCFLQNFAIQQAN